jgi:protein-tyrosine phosphatase
MIQIEGQPLWLGHAGEGREYQQLYDAGIQAVVQVAAEELPAQAPRDLISCHFPVLDGTGNRGRLLFLVVTTLATFLRLHIPTLVCCSMGRSRAPALAAAALALVHQQPPEAWLERITQRHPADVSPGLWNDLVALLPSLR